MKQPLNLIIFLFLALQSIIAQQIKSPSEFLGYELGSQFSRHADVVNYFEHVAQNSALVQYYTYGKTNERRPLTYAVITSEENMGRIDEIRQAHLQKAGIGDTSTNSDMAIVWLSYNVHGNEASSTEASMKTLYHLITEKEDYLKNTVVIIDPCVNPDGRDRYANWYNQVKAEPYNISQEASEHHEPWPGGRPNHYLFDLNRDWAWATQIETRERLKIYNQWLPHIHVDFHEQGINDPYYFAPAAEPFHEVITPFQRDFQTRIGKNHAKYFDEEGWLYFTGERFDLLYPSYGDTYPTYMGSIGMTYEQAGHGRAGLGIQTDEGFVLTLKDRVEHHFTTGISTVEVASRNASELNQEFQNYFEGGDFQYKSYALKGNPDKLRTLQELLDRHEITYSKVRSEKINGYNYQNKGAGSLPAGTGTMIVSTDQPKGKMVKVLFEPQTRLVDSLTYDITAWSLPYAYGLDAVASNKLLSGTAENATASIDNKANPRAAGYITKWNSMQDAQFLAELLKSEIKVRVSEVPFESNGKKFAPGSLIITKSDNQNLDNFHAKVVAIANEYERQLLTAETSFAGSGPDFGSSDIKIINQQRIGLLKGKEVSSLNFGEIWYFMEQDLNYPVTPLHTDYFERVDLSDFDVLIMPEGWYKDFMDKKTLEKIKTWVSSGGKLIAIGSAVGSFKDKAGFKIKDKRDSLKDSTAKKTNLIPYAERERESIKNLITGSIIKTQVDHTHPLAFGYDDTYFTLKVSNSSYDLLEEGYNVSYIKDAEVVSGFAGSEAVKNLNNSLVFGEVSMGSGSIIYMVDNPLFRAFWENGKLFFVNALFFTNNTVKDY
ncbi:M14 family metallopeptidase [Christiangramia sabulilitoris]|uniref:Zinc carboxypeptidase n=1 Tax=Christiangramia sabulilitoris TaxID=2583991 RepID=A0A550I387_9FLAO|nr:M14 family metallopeptidase [Christiangramia sabulilitoris]TRO65278.1 zinc carboxypeptidase [Christiangramia sabulilitoris]